MSLKNAFKKSSYVSLGDENDINKTPEVPEGIMKKCNYCKSAIFTEDVKNNYNICPKCGGHFRIHARTRIEMLTDIDSFEEWDKDISYKNPLEYSGYEDKIKVMQEKTKLTEAVVTGKAKINGEDTAIGVMDSRFIMASMGWAVGEKITRLFEKALEEKLPVILVCASGGARMQEGITSLMQMAKTSAAIKRFSDNGGLYISLLTNPTTGGVTASFAMLGDIILAEPDALIGFAGPRVIEQTIGQKLPKGFQKSEFLLEHGFIDRIVKRKEMKQVLSDLLKVHGCERNICTEVCEDNEHICELKSMNPWSRVEKSRAKDRPVGTFYIESLFDKFIEMHGDRYFGDDPAIVGGVAMFHGCPVTVIAEEKGSTTKDNIKRNFGMPSPEGYRKALRLMKQAEKFKRPVICFVDTPGAFCGLEAEERGQGEAIASNLYEMSGLKVPVVSIVIGEGGSGGALAMAVADEVWMLENSIYSILSPEGFASILWKDSKRAKEAAELMRLTAADLKAAGIIEDIIPEPEHLTTETFSCVKNLLDNKLKKFITTYIYMDADEIVQRRYDRFRVM